MQRCLQLASMGAGTVAPNPMVGAILVWENRIIGEGYHRQYGGPHAEVDCIRNVAETDAHLISKSTLYVSLEPCTHTGKTPPCTDLIIQKKIPRVVIGCRDPFPEVNGKGIEKLTAAGVIVTEGILEKESKELNKRFFVFHMHHRPYIILKWAQSRDKRISGVTGERVLISNEYTNRLVHKWRTEESAICVGTKTAKQDDPLLTARLWPGNDPVRLVIDMELKLPLSLHLFDKTVRTIVFNKLKQHEEGSLSYFKVNSENNVIKQILEALYVLKIQSVMVEGGAELLQSFIDENAWDEARVITNQQLAIDNGLPAPVLADHQLALTENLQTDLIETYVPAIKTPH